MKVRVVHVITGLTTGGAEMMLYKLLAASDRDRFASAVISLMTAGTIGPRIAEAGIPVHALGMHFTRPMPGPWLELRRLLRHYQPDIVQGWMYHANVAATAAVATLGTRPPVLWNIRQSLYDLKAEKASTAAVIRLGARLSGSTRHILYNATLCAEQHEAIGYARARRQVIYNGFDIEKFQPIPDARRQLREALGLSLDTIVIGIVGRYHMIKGHQVFIEAADHLVATHPAVNFVMVGTDVTWDNPALQTPIQAAGLAPHFHLLGERRDIPAIMAGLDILTNSSRFEAFPNVLGEAMACAIPCVATDVGESPRIVADTGRIVPVDDPAALAGAWRELLEMDPAARQALGQAARHRVETCYALPQIVSAYQTLYTSVLGC